MKICLEYYARSAPELEVIDLSPDERLASSKLGRKILREIIYPLKIRSRAKRYTRLGRRPILHVIDHSYGHLCRFWTPAVVTCHDLNHYVCPSLKGTELLNWKFRVRGMLSAARIIAVSHHLAGEITSFLKIPPERITVAYNGVDSDVFSIGTAMEAAERFPHLAELRKGHRLVLNIGTNAGRKNLPTLLRAIARLKHERRLPVKLMKAGSSLTNDGFGPLIEKLGIEGEVIELGLQRPEAVAALCRLAHALAFPRLNEGFGRPTIEAQAAGLVCVLADSSCMREVGGEGALYHEPLDDQQLAAQLEIAMTNEELRQRLIGDGYANAKRFTWHAHVRKLVDVYAEVAAKQCRSQELQESRSSGGKR